MSDTSMVGFSDGGPAPAVFAGGTGFVDRVLVSVLTHRATLAIKRLVRDVIWRFKALEIDNPPVPAAALSLLFVCLGNICRSPFAAALCRRHLAANGLTEVRCASAGIRAVEGGRPPQDACDAAARFGVSLDSHEPLQVTGELLDSFDLIVVMEAQHLLMLRLRYPQAAKKLVLLSLFDGRDRGAYVRYNIADPFGQPAAAFGTCYEHIEGALPGLLTAVGLTRR